MANEWDHVVGTQEYEKNLARINNIAQRMEYTLNPEKKRIAKVVGLMTMNYTSLGQYYCPCKQSEPPAPDKDVVCPCLSLKDEVNKDGYCYCRLFFKT